MSHTTQNKTNTGNGTRHQAISTTCDILELSVSILD